MTKQNKTDVSNVIDVFQIDGTVKTFWGVTHTVTLPNGNLQIWVDRESPRCKAEYNFHGWIRFESR